MGPLAAQQTYVPVDRETRLRSVAYTFPEGRTLELARIRQETVLTDPGFASGLRRALSWLPLVSAPERARFEPLELQKDVARLRRLYGDMGFYRAAITYDVALDAPDNVVDVRFSIREGPFVVLDSMTVVGADGRSIESSIPPQLTARWSASLQRFRDEAVGRRFGQLERQRLRSEPLRWARDNGYAFASVEDQVHVDTARAVSTAHIMLDLGPRAVVDSIEIEGNVSLRRGTLLRELPFEVGDWYSSLELSEGQRQIFGLPLVRLALADLPPDQPRDSTVTVRYRIEEGRPRVLSGEVGYSSISGIRTRADWTDRDYMGDARSLTVSLDARSAWLALEGDRDQTLGASVSLRQPYLFDRRISGALAPFIEYRDGFVDRSWAYGIGASVLWEKAPTENVSIEYRLSSRRILDVRAGVEDLEGIDFIDALAALDSLESGARSSVLSISTLHGQVDDPLDPGRGWILRTSLQIAGPAAISAVEYVRGQADLARFIPLGGDVSLALRGGAGLLRPFGVSAPNPQSDTLALFVRLREAMLTAGGTRSVRGWESGLLGPKVPNYRIASVGDSLTLIADRYIPFAGLARITTSAELQLPMPFSESEHGTFLFLDGGKVWNPDERFGGGGRDPFGQERFFWAAGAGLRFETLAGAARISVGYKLNPAPFDLRDPRLVAAALVDGTPIEAVPTDAFRRIHLHLSIGRGF